MVQHKALAMPNSQSLLLFQDQLLRDKWHSRHIDRLSENPQTGQLLLGLLGCTKDLVEAMQSDSAPKLKQQSSRNLVCLCHAVCPEETLDWARCVKKAASEQQDACTHVHVHTLLSSTLCCYELWALVANVHYSFAGAVKQGLEPDENCAKYRMLLERCTQRKTSFLLHSALWPPT